jgi:glycogen debranching enzyme
VLGDDDSGRWAARADKLRSAFNDAFWIPSRGQFALALDGQGRQVDALASNMGQCLWTGIVDEDKASDVAGHLMSPELFSGWGVRTLATSMQAYNPLSYHNGAVWPHDNALIAAGLVRYGYRVEAQELAEAIIDTAAFFEGRLPELFCGFSREDAAAPIPYPASCSPQAWAAAAPMSLVSSLLDLQLCIPHGELSANPAQPPGWGRLTLEGVAAGAEKFTVSAAGTSLVETPTLTAR